MHWETVIQPAFLERDPRCPHATGTNRIHDRIVLAHVLAVFYTSNDQLDFFQSMTLLDQIILQDLVIVFVGFHPMFSESRFGSRSA